MFESSSGLDLAATHLNASVGPVVTAAHIAQALRAGSLQPLVGDPDVEAMVSFLFVEVQPQLIARCATEAGVNLLQAHALYIDTLEKLAPRAPAWEAEMEPFL
ncbi:hypothetical protein CDN99_12030 [Roseateles aquatilis]|uniref:Uncharacterized protein n=1 Tax=Roseateles aquatilis TaxID=431061 RepID=A0A246JE08_9BURK|nr:hypothetical protein [Roseateles aquatilis]OWQ90882.1 hypothetical protein CDN99_12030 [Roseateles aquatilis]